MKLPVMVSDYNPTSGHTWVIDSRQQSTSILMTNMKKMTATIYGAFISQNEKNQDHF